MVQSSIDSGKTWNAPVDISPAPPKGSEFDPWFSISPLDGHTVSVAFLQGYPHAAVSLVDSHDGGTTWSAPQSPSDRPAPLDKTVLVARGSLMAIAYTDYNVNIWASVSRDAGAHWTTHKIEFDGAPTQELSAGGGIDSHGNIYFAWNAYYVHRRPPAHVWVTKSSDAGATWTHSTIAASGAPRYCRQCNDHEYFAPQMALTVGSDDAIYLLWNSTPGLSDGVPERIYFARSLDRGRTYSARRDVSDAPQGVEHCFPTLVAGRDAGDVRLAWMDRRTGPWNVFYRASVDGGRMFEPSIRLSTYAPGYKYLTRKGFDFPYGDYLQLAVDPNGRTHAAFGETAAYPRPGNIWVANQL